MKKYKQKKRTLKREPEAIHQNPSKFEDRQEQAHTTAHLEDIFELTSSPKCDPQQWEL